MGHLLRDSIRRYHQASQWICNNFWKLVFQRVNYDFKCLVLSPCLFVLCILLDKHGEQFDRHHHWLLSQLRRQKEGTQGPTCLKHLHHLLILFQDLNLLLNLLFHHYGHLWSLILQRIHIHHCCLYLHPIMFSLDDRHSSDTYNDQIGQHLQRDCLLSDLLSGHWQDLYRGICWQNNECAFISNRP